MNLRRPACKASALPLSYPPRRSMGRSIFRAKIRSTAFFLTAVVSRNRVCRPPRTSHVSLPKRGDPAHSSALDRTVQPLCRDEALPGDRVVRLVRARFRTLRGHGLRHRRRQHVRGRRRLERRRQRNDRQQQRGIRRLSRPERREREWRLARRRPRLRDRNGNRCPTAGVPAHDPRPIAQHGRPRQQDRRHVRSGRDRAGGLDVFSEWPARDRPARPGAHDRDWSAPTRQRPSRPPCCRRAIRPRAEPTCARR